MSNISYGRIGRGQKKNWVNSTYNVLIFFKDGNGRNYSFKNRKAAQNFKARASRSRKVSRVVMN